MPRVHFLNVGNGACSIIQHGSGRVSLIDICNGSPVRRERTETHFAAEALSSINKPRGDFKMRDHLTNPLQYLVDNIGCSIFRFILTHPDMDHMDGIKALCDEVSIFNFWDSGVRRDKPDFGDNGPYREEDWGQYELLRDGHVSDLTVVHPRAGSQFQFANKGDPGDPDDEGDYLSVVAPNAALVQHANKSEDPNDGSYVLVYRTCGGKIIFGGDAHDNTWEYIISHHKAAVHKCAVLIAPHHGRDSDRCYDFLDTLNPAITLFGCAESEHLAYDAWNNRNLPYLTSNQAGNIVLDATNERVDVYAENLSFAKGLSTHDVRKTLNGATYIGTVEKPRLPERSGRNA